jgi:predicted unusual protein kinase regulating ubiquinone biosynthesis (AarF/ABC1/UbiB family)
MLRNQIQDVLDRYLHRSLGNLNLAGLLTDVFEVVRYFGITPPPDLLLIARSLTACHHIGTLIDPTFEPLEALAPYLTKRYYQLIFSPRKYKKQLANLANDYYRLITDLPLDAHNLLHQLSREELTIYHKIRDSDGYLRHQNRMTNRWVMTFMGGILLMGGIFMEGPANTINSIRCILLLWGAVILFLVWRAVKKSGGT